MCVYTPYIIFYTCVCIYIYMHAHQDRNGPALTCLRVCVVRRIVNSRIRICVVLQRPSSTVRTKGTTLKIYVFRETGNYALLCILWLHTRGTRRNTHSGRNTTFLQCRDPSRSRTSGAAQYEENNKTLERAHPIQSTLSCLTNNILGVLLFLGRACKP